MIQTLIILTTLLLPQVAGTPALAPPIAPSTFGGSPNPTSPIQGPTSTLGPVPALNSLGGSSDILPKDPTDPEYQDEVGKKIKIAGQVLTSPGKEDRYAVVLQLPPEAISMLQAGTLGYKINVEIPPEVLDYASILTVQAGEGYLRQDPVPTPIKQKRDLVKMNRLRANGSSIVANLNNPAGAGLSNIDVNPAVNQFGPNSPSAGGSAGLAGAGRNASEVQQPTLPPPNVGSGNAIPSLRGDGFNGIGGVNTSPSASVTNSNPPNRQSAGSGVGGNFASENASSNPNRLGDLSAIPNGRPNPSSANNTDYEVDEIYPPYGGSGRDPRMAGGQQFGQGTGAFNGPEARLSQNNGTNPQRETLGAEDWRNYGAGNSAGGNVAGGNVPNGNAQQRYQDSNPPYSGNQYQSQQYQSPQPIQNIPTGPFRMPNGQLMQLVPQIAELPVVPVIGKEESTREAKASDSDKLQSELAAQSGDDSGSRFLPIITLILLAINIYQFFWMTHVRTRYKEMVISKRNAQISMSNS